MTAEEANYTTLEIESEKLLPEFKKKALTAKQKQQTNFKTGYRGEKRAAKYLAQNGYRVIEQNLQVGYFELDIIAHDQEYNELVFVEVKNRATDRFGHPSGTVTRKKLRKLTAAAQRYIDAQQLQVDYRFDIITITGSKLEHFKNISWNF